MPLLDFTKNGIYCSQAGVYIDPWRKVEKAIITHGHSDHARRGHSAYLCTHRAKPTIKHRLGKKINIESIDFGEQINMNGVHFSFHPAGHILGSAQVRVEYQGEVWVVSGDYKTEEDGFTIPFEVVPCHTFITECTFGLPVYKWRPQNEVFEEINNWWYENANLGRVSLLTGYSLGKAQRLLQNVDPEIGQIFVHPTIEKVNEVIRNQGVELNPTTEVTADLGKEDFKGSLVIATPSVINTPWMRQMGKVSTATASGWMMNRKARKNREVDRGFVLSDHGDWDDLIRTIKETGAENIFVTHGFTKELNQWLNESGFNSKIVKTKFTGEEDAGV
ncbi:MAG: ligase-associated DNA damage response exonuclease [Saprospiraceae bacterium]|nr:ligase-associated DNA damage response exonuclease [Saprospiraceae bacterium]